MYVYRVEIRTTILVKRVNREYTIVDPSRFVQSDRLTFRSYLDHTYDHLKMSYKPPSSLSRSLQNRRKSLEDENPALRASTVSHRDVSISPPYSYLHLKPATRRTVTTTTTTTTVHFAPIPIPRPLPPTALTETETAQLPPKPWISKSLPPVPGEPLDPRLYPLFKVASPSSFKNFPLKFGETNALLTSVETLDARSTALKPPFFTSTEFARRSTKGKSKARDDTVSSSPQMMRERSSHSRRRELITSTGTSRRPSISASKISPLQSTSYSRQIDSLAQVPPRKRIRTDETLTLPLSEMLKSPIISRSHSGAGTTAPLPSPQLSPGDNTYELEAFAPASPQSSTNEAPEDSNVITTTKTEVVQSDDLTTLDFGTGIELSTLMSLQSLVETFASLSPDLQSYVLFHLLKRSSVPVLQAVNDVITPALKRDFIVDLPPELAVNILTFLDGQTLCRACAVSKAWKKLVDGEWRIWKQRLLSENLWTGHGSEQRDVATIQGRPFIDPKQLFLSRWNDGVWNIDFDEAEAARPTAEKIRNARRLSSRPTPADDEEEISPQFTPRRVFSEFDESDEIFDEAYPTPPSPNSDGTFAPIASRTFANLSQYAVHPLKLVYRQRYITRNNWSKAEPRHVNFQGQGNNVVTCLQFDREKIISASDARLIHVYDIRNGRQRATLDGHQGGVWALQYIGNTMVSGSTDRTVRVWDLATKRCTHTLLGHSSTVRCLQIVEPINVNPDPSGPPVWEPPYPLIITGSRDWTLRVWKLPKPGRDAEFHATMSDAGSDDTIDTQSNPYHLRLLSGHKLAVRSLAAHGRLLVSGSYDSHVRVWDSLSGECIHDLKGHTAKVYAVVLDYNRSICASGSMDGTVRMWSTTTGECLRELEGHQSLVGLLGLDRNHLVSAAADSTLRVWDARTGFCRSVLAPHAGAITCFQHDESKVISGSDGTLKMWDIRTGNLVRDLLVGVAGVWQVSFDQRFCIAAVQRNGQSEFSSKHPLLLIAFIASQSQSVLDFGTVPFTNDLRPPSPSPEPLSETSEVEFDLRANLLSSNIPELDEEDENYTHGDYHYVGSGDDLGVADVEPVEDDVTVYNDEGDIYRSSPLARHTRAEPEHHPWSEVANLNMSTDVDVPETEE